MYLLDDEGAGAILMTYVISLVLIVMGCALAYQLTKLADRFAVPIFATVISMNISYQVCMLLSAKNTYFIGIAIIVDAYFAC